jgi:hypothetical protein
MNASTSPALLAQVAPIYASSGGNEMAATAMAAHSKATVEARYQMALLRPRNWDQVRQDLIKECERPSFADNKSTYYKKPSSSGPIEGLGIRFVEVALRCMKNVMVESKLVYESEDIEVHSVTVTDLEGNLTYPLDVPVDRTVERSKPASDGSFISKRKNSSGGDTYLVPATEDDMQNKRGALISKAIRTVGLRIIPGWLSDECIATIKATRLDRAAQDPATERNRIADGFDAIGVKVVDLVAYLGHSLDQCSPAQLVELRAIWAAIDAGEATWQSTLDSAEDRKAKRGSPSRTVLTKEQATGASASVAADKTASTPASVQQVSPRGPTDFESGEISSDIARTSSKSNELFETPAGSEQAKEKASGPASSSQLATDGEKKRLMTLAKQKPVAFKSMLLAAGLEGFVDMTQREMADIIEKGDITGLAGMTTDQFIAVRDNLKA